MPFENTWNLPKETIDRLELIVSPIHMGTSFMDQARVFEIAEIGDCYLLECDLLGKVNEFKLITVLFNWRRGCKYCFYLTHDILEDITRKDFLFMLNFEIRKVAHAILTSY